MPPPPPLAESQPDRARTLVHWIVLFAILSVGAWLRSHLNNTGTAGLVFMRTDESHYTKMVGEFLQGDWKVDYFVNPTLYMYLLYAATSVSGWIGVATGHYDSFGEMAIDATMDPYLVTIIGRSISLIVGVGSIALIYHLACRLFSTRAGLIAALLLAVNMTHTDRGALAGNELPMVLTLLLCFHALVRYLEQPTTGRHLLAGLFLGLAASFKYNAGIQMVALLVATLTALVDPQTREAPLWSRIRQARHWAAFPAAAIGFLIGSPYVLLNFAEFWIDFRFQSDLLHSGFGEHRTGWTYYILQLGPGNSGWPVAAFMLLGLGVCLFRALGMRDKRCILALAAVLPTYLLLGGGIFCQMRFLLPAIPILILMASGTLDTIARMAPRVGLHSSLATSVLTATLVSAMVGPHAWGLQKRMAARYGERDPRAELVDWMREKIPAGTHCFELHTDPGALFFPLASNARKLRDKSFDTPGQKMRYEQLQKDSFRADSMRKTVLNSKDLVAFEAALLQAEQTHLILSLFSPRRIVKKELDSEIQRIVSNLKMKRDAPYWRDAAMSIMKMKKVGQITSSDRRYVVCVLELPRP
ncbi:MAG: hypothetical protein ACI841_002440 [Planctomycetota bacterium]|jgi:hypothetical protein